MHLLHLSVPEAAHHFHQLQFSQSVVEVFQVPAVRVASPLWRLEHWAKSCFLVTVDDVLE